jgi:DNA-binding beta-propeller fold protein YncE
MMRAKFWLALTAVFVLVSRTAGQALTSHIYWTKDVSAIGIYSATPTGSDIQQISSYPDVYPARIAIDPFERKLYWTEQQEDSIRRANLDGSDSQIIWQDPFAESVLGLTVDPFNKKLYWTGNGHADILRSNLDGSEVETLYHATTGIKDLRDIAVDPFGGKMYWVNAWNSTLNWANLDGSNPQVFVPLTVDYTALSIDFVHRKMYWGVSIPSNQRIARANLDGTNVENILIGSSIVRPEGLVVDGVSGKMYWTEIDGSRIRRANLDGTQIETIVTNVGFARRIAIDGSPVPEPASAGILLISMVASTLFRCPTRRFLDSSQQEQ